MNNARYLIFSYLLTACVLAGVARGGRPTAEQLKTIFLRLYAGDSEERYVDQPADNAGQLVGKMENNKPTVLYIHGFTESVESESLLTVVRGYLKRHDHNVLAADFRNISNQPYVKLAKSVYDIGVVLAGALNEMVHAGWNPERLHIVGHSIGAQVAGHIGRQTSFVLPRITGLDPAGPFFNFLEVYLSSADAGFVDIIHTDYGIYGSTRTSGTVDFFPNGGRRLQPGCPTNASLFSREDFCSHQRSWAFYAESLISENAFLSLKCPTYYQFVNGECIDNERVVMGIDTPRTAQGVFYLNTAAQSPYGLGEDGVRIATSNDISP